MNVVVIGGGLAGVAVATTLAKMTAKTDLRITLVEPKDYVEIRWASIRALFDQDIASRSLLSLSTGLQAYGTITHVRSKAVSMTASSVKLEGDTTLPFDACLVATGAQAAYGPLASMTVARDKRLKELSTAGRALIDAESVLVVGGGLIGAELAGDAAAYRVGGAPTNGASQKQAEAGAEDCKVTLVHSRELLAAPMAKKGADKLRTKLSGLGVEVVTNEYADRSVGEGGEGEKWKGRESGREYNHGHVVNAVGVKAHNGGAMVRDGVPGAGDSVDERGWIKTDEFGRVAGAGGAVFALGDCTQGDFKSGAIVLERKNAVAHNLRAVITALKAGKAAGEAERLKNVPSGMPIVAATVGPRAGVVQTPLFTDSVVLPKLKNKTMFIARAKGQLGV